MKAVLVTTEHRGVFFGYVENDADLTQTTLALKDAKMAIYWGTSRGLMELCEDGPNDSSRISAPADIPVLHKVTAVFDVTEKAEKSWSQA